MLTSNTPDNIINTSLHPFPKRLTLQCHGVLHPRYLTVCQGRQVGPLFGRYLYPLGNLEWLTPHQYSSLESLPSGLADRFVQSLCPSVATQYEDLFFDSSAITFLPQKNCICFPVDKVRYMLPLATCKTTASPVSGPCMPQTRAAPAGGDVHKIRLFQSQWQPTQSMANITPLKLEWSRPGTTGHTLPQVSTKVQFHPRPPSYPRP